jgi:hypothetical protein
MEKSVCGIPRSGGCFDRYLSIWRCQNRYDGSDNWGNIVERCLDGSYVLEMARFYQSLGFHLDFQLQKLVLALKQGFL